MRLGDGRSFVGSSTTVEVTVGPEPLVLAENVKNTSAAVSDAKLCEDGSLDPAKVAGTIVVCDRGVNPRVAKSAEVARAGGVGMVLVNTSDLETDADLHTLPTVHLNVPDTATIHSYAATQGATASLVPGGTTGQPYPQIAPFSSRGPSVANKGDLLKPDIAAPGVGILAAVAPPSNSGLTGPGPEVHRPPARGRLCRAALSSTSPPEHDVPERCPSVHLHVARSGCLIRVSAVWAAHRVARMVAGGLSVESALRARGFARDSAALDGTSSAHASRAGLSIRKGPCGPL